VIEGFGAAVLSASRQILTPAIARNGQENYIVSKSNARFCDVDRAETSSKHQRRIAEISPIRGGVVSQDYDELNKPEAHLRGAEPDRAHGRIKESIQNSWHLRRPRERATANLFWN
jgi:hypothetical protein